MHSCLYLQVLYRGGPKTDCSTVLGLFTSRSEEGVNVITTDVCLWGGGVKDHMHRVRESSYGWVHLGWWRHETETRQSNVTANSTTSRPPPHKPYVAFEYAQYGVFYNCLLRNTVQGHGHCLSVRSFGNESMLGLEDLDLIPEQFQSRSSSGSQRECRLIAVYLQPVYCRVF